MTHNRKSISGCQCDKDLDFGLSKTLAWFWMMPLFE